jgi:choline kinase
MKAVVLAAGCATRLRPHTADTPKTLLAAGGVPILRRTITSLLRLGVEEFVIGTGYLEHKVRHAVEHWFPDLAVTFVSNPDFRTTNNGYSLSLCAPVVSDHAFVLLDGDVVFDLGVMEQLLEHGPDCLAVRSVGDIGLEEVKVACDHQDRVTAIGKHVPVRGAMGESVGIELFSASTSRHLFATLEEQMRRGMVNEYYEAAFQQIIDEGAVLHGVDIGTKFATEIDTIDDLRSCNNVLAAQAGLDITAPIRIAV